ncbi:histidine kinase [Sutcliffiella horikoshii]|uniref:Histidine kinase n=1 Tax=Sutcliffiella horikoshii TaxID=79883 RepID=A0AA94WN83_9BACI|nr:histidine kinase [Sutcliffiella horikoshii]TYS58742.1 histidine kinase [Sutcliffiella horikoshii]
MEKVRWFLYTVAGLLIVIPTMYVFIADTYFSSVTSNILISKAILLVILGKLISVFEKKKENGRYAVDIGAIIGLAIVLIIGIV